MSTPPSKTFFITSTGTDIGKTFVTCALSNQLSALGKKVRAIKPIISGYSENINTDTSELMLACSEEDIEKVSPWRLKEPLSPNIAAERQGISINIDEVKDFCLKMREGTDYLLIEGAGGVLTPLTSLNANADLIKMLGIPAVLVAGSYLGTISHTLTAIEALKARGITISSLLISKTNDEDDVNEIIMTIMSFHALPIIVIPRIKDSNWRESPNILHSIGVFNER